MLTPSETIVDDILDAKDTIIGRDARQTAANAVLPVQVGQRGKVLTTDGQNASWQTLNIDITGKVDTSTQVIAGEGLVGGGTLNSTVGLSVEFGEGPQQVARGNDQRIKNGQLAYTWGNHANFGYSKSDTLYYAGRGLSLEGQTFSLPVEVVGEGDVVKRVVQDAEGLKVIMGSVENDQYGAGRGISLINEKFHIVFGTKEGTAAAGNDARITNAAQTNQNLGDLRDKEAARSNLGLGTFATKNVTVSDELPTGGDDGDVWLIV